MTEEIKPREITYHKELVDLEEYKTGVMVVISEDTEWREVNIVTPPVADIQTGKITMTIDSTNPREIVLDYAPQIIKFGENTSGNKKTIVDHPLDGKRGTKYTIDSHRITDKGKVEYDLVPSGTPKRGTEPVRGVSQAFLELWKGVETLEKQMKKLAKEIEKRTHILTTDLQTHRVGMETKLAELRAGLPRLEDMPKKDETAIREIEERFEELQTEAEAALKVLKEALDEVEDVEEREVLTTDIYFHETPEEVQERKAFASRLSAQIEKEIVKRNKPHEKNIEVAKKEIENAEKEIEKIKKERKDRLAAIRRGRGNANRNLSNNERDEFNRREQEQKDIVLVKRATIKTEEENKEESIKEVWFDISESSATTHDPHFRELITRLIDIRTKQVQRDPLAIKDNSNTDYARDKKIDGSDLVAGEPEYLSVHAEKTTELLKDLLQSWKDKDILEPPADIVDVRDFEEETKKIDEGIDILIQRVLTDNNKPKKEFEELHNRLKVLSDRWNKQGASLLTIEKNVGGTRSAKMKKGFDQERVNALNAMHAELEKLTEEIGKKENEETTKKADKEIQNARATVVQAELQTRVEETEYETLTIDIPPKEIHELMMRLDSVSDDVHVIMRALYEGLVGEQEREVPGEDTVRSIATIRADARDRMMHLFDIPPNTETLDRLRKYGIKNWDQFVRMWQEELGEKTLKTMNEMAEASVRAKVAERSTELSAKLKQMWGMKGQLATKMLITGGFYGGAAAVIAAIGASGGALALASMAGVGAAGGVARWAGVKAVFGNNKLGKFLEERREKMNAELTEAMRGDVVDSLMAEQFGSITRRKGGKDVTAEKYRDNMSTNPSNEIEGMWQFSAILSQVMREKTDEGKELAGEHPDDLVTQFTANERLTYERSLAQLERQNPEMKQKRELAQLILHVRSRGEELEAEVEALKSRETSVEKDVQTKADAKGIKPSRETLIDRIMKNYGGRGSLPQSIVMGILVSGALSANRETMKAFGMAAEASMVSRGALGGVFGAIEGWKSGGQAIDKRQRMKRRSELVDRMERVNEHVVTLLNNSSLPSGTDIQEVESDFLYLKQLLHGNVSGEELSAVVVPSKEHGILPDRLLLTQIQSLIYEGDRVGIMYESKEQRATLDTVLSTMKRSGDKIAEGQKRSLGKIVGQFSMKYGARTLGAVVGGALGFAAGVGFGSAFDNLREGQPPWSTSGATYEGEIDTSEFVAKVNEAVKEAMHQVPHAEGVVPYIAPDIPAVGEPGDAGVGHVEGGGGVVQDGGAEAGVPEHEPISHTVPETISIKNGDNPWKLIRHGLDETFANDPAYNNLTESGKNWLADGLKDQYMKDPSAYRESFLPGKEFELGKLVEDSGGVEGVLEKMPQVDPGNVENHDLLRQLAITEAKMEIKMATAPETEAFVENIKGGIVVDQAGKTHFDGSQFQNISADKAIGAEFNPGEGTDVPALQVKDIVGVEQHTDFATLKFADGKSLDVYPKPTTNGWQMHDPADLPSRQPVYVDMTALNAELAQAVQQANDNAMAPPEAPSNVVNLDDHRNGSGMGDTQTIAEGDGLQSEQGADADVYDLQGNRIEAVPHVSIEEFTTTMKGFEEWMTNQIGDVQLVGSGAVDTLDKFHTQFNNEHVAANYNNEGNDELFDQFRGNQQQMFESMREGMEMTPEQEVLFSDTHVDIAGSQDGITDVLVNPEGSHAMKFVHEGQQIFYQDSTKIFSNSADGRLIVSEGGRTYYGIPEITNTPEGRRVAIIDVGTLAQEILDQKEAA